MTYRILVAVALLDVIGCFAQGVAPSGQEGARNPFSGTVRVLAFGMQGGKVEGPEVEHFESVSRGGDIAESFRNGIADNVPWGFYRIEVSAPDCVSESRYVSVFETEVAVLVGLACAFENPTLAETNGVAIPPYPILRGRVVGFRPPGKELIARMVGVFSSQSLEAVVGSGGEFEMSVPRDGKYVLMILDDKNVLAIELVGSPHAGRLEIRVGSTGPVGGLP